MSIVERPPMNPMVGDPDDHRPDPAPGTEDDAPRRGRDDLRTGAFEPIE